MTNRERLQRVLNFQIVDRLPTFEWATWWDKTVNRWHVEGVPEDAELFSYFGLDDIRQFWLPQFAPGCPDPKTYGGEILSSEEDYERLKGFLYNLDTVKNISQTLRQIKPLHDRGDFPVWITFEGFFWFPRTLFGIENHLYSFYDKPELYHRICRDLVNWQLRMLDEFCEILTPDFMTFAEDMSYNHGPMLSKALFDEFIKPYYQMIVPELKRRGIKVIVDSDGNVIDMVPWLREGGIEGILPLERQAGTDIGAIRRQFPDFLMIGGFDKLVIKNGEAAVRAEFERILPVMKSGGYIPGVDHQTPPEVSVENYKIYLKIFKKYCSMV